MTVQELHELRNTLAMKIAETKDIHALADLMGSIFEVQQQIMTELETHSEEANS